MHVSSYSSAAGHFHCFCIGSSKFSIILHPVLGLVDREVLAQQKRLLSKQLGLDVGASLGIPGTDLIADEDLVLRPEAPAPNLTGQVWINSFYF